MAERAGPGLSLLLERGRASDTAEYTAAMRADHRLHDTAPVLDDVWALQLIGPRLREAVESGGLRRFLEERGLRPTQGHVVLRQRLADDALAAAVSRGTRQLLVLAAGLDSSCLRRDPRVRVIEVDHPASQSVKRSRLAALGVSLPGVEFAPVDFASESLAAALGRTGLDPRQPAFVSWLGVSMYLPVETGLATLGQIRASVSRDSELVFDYPIPAERLDPELRELARIKNEGLARSGEPRIASFDPAELTRALALRGFELIEDIGPAELDGRYCAGRADDFRANPENRIAHARAV
jgi:methyltransferase (TIGR00027 family)